MTYSEMNRQKVPKLQLAFLSEIFAVTNYADIKVTKSLSLSSLRETQ